MGLIFADDNHVKAWVEAAEGIRRRFGTDKALGYVIGEKFYELVSILHAARTMVRVIDEERKKPNYTAVRERTYGKCTHGENLEETYQREKEVIAEAERLLTELTTLIRQAFQPYEIRNYLESHPRFGALGHIASDEEYDLMIRTGAIEHSLDTEVEDALIFGEMLRYFGMSR